MGRYLEIKKFHTFILSNFNFCPLAWHFCTDKNSKKLEKVQERALRFVSMTTPVHISTFLKNSSALLTDQTY